MYTPAAAYAFGSHHFANHKTPNARALEAQRGANVSPASFSPSSNSTNSSVQSLNHASAGSPSSPASTGSRSSAGCATSQLPRYRADTGNCRRSSGQNALSYELPATTSGPQQANELAGFTLLESLEPKPLKSFRNGGEYVEAMIEDLAEWLNRLYPDLDLMPQNFFEQIENGAIICMHANNVTKMGRNLAQQQMGAETRPRTGERTNHLRASNSRSQIPRNKSGSLSSSKSYSSLNFNSIAPKHKHTPSSNKSQDRTIDWLSIKTIPFKMDARPGTFFARDNICQFILWCRSINILECLLFETDDLVARKNERSFILCLLEVARIGFKVGMPTPLIIQLEQEIDREIEKDARLQRQLEEKLNQDESHEHLHQDRHDELNGIHNQVSCSADEAEEQEDYGPKPQVITNDLVSLHEKVVQLLCQCTCPTQFPMVRVGDNGKYKVGDKLTIFVRILRRHIMVRVGGGWQELSEFLRAKDPCRAKIYQPPANNHNHQHQQPTKLSPNSTMTKSRLVESSHHLNKAHHYLSGQKLISGSASMSWLANNS